MSGEDIYRYYKETPSYISTKFDIIGAKDPRWEKYTKYIGGHLGDDIADELNNITFDEISDQSDDNVDLGGDLNIDIGDDKIGGVCDQVAEADIKDGLRDGARDGKSYKLVPTLDQYIGSDEYNDVIYDETTDISNFII